MNASIGMAVGEGLNTIAAVTTLVTLVVLVVIGPLERYFERRSMRGGEEHPGD